MVDSIITTIIILIIEGINGETISCDEEGFHAILNRCNEYAVCVNGIEIVMSCPAGLVWDQVSLSIKTQEIIVLLG